MKKTALGFFPVAPEEWMLTAFGSAGSICPKPDKRHMATDCIDWWKRCSIGAPLFVSSWSSSANRHGTRFQTGENLLLRPDEGIEIR